MYLCHVIEYPLCGAWGILLLLYNHDMNKIFCDDCGKDITHEAKYIWKNKLRCVDCNEKIPESEFDIDFAVHN